MPRERIPRHRPSIPRKWSIDDPSGRAWAREYGNKIKITLDGVTQHRVIGYDADAGTVTRYKRDAEGKIVIDRTKGVGVQETVTGKVELSWLQS